VNNGNLYKIREAIRLTIESLPYFNYYYGKIQDLNNAGENTHLANLFPIRGTIDLNTNETQIGVYNVEIVFTIAIDNDSDSLQQGSLLDELEISVRQFIDSFNTNYPEYYLTNITFLEDNIWAKFKTQVVAILLRFSITAGFDYNC
jgi:hypothetical protein